MKWNIVTANMHITKLHLVDCFVYLCLKFYYKLIADLKNYSYNASKLGLLGASLQMWFTINHECHMHKKVTSEYMLGIRYITLFWVVFFCSQDIDRKKTWSIYNLEHNFLFFLNLGLHFIFEFSIYLFHKTNLMKLLIQ